MFRVILFPPSQIPLNSLGHGLAFNESSLSRSTQLMDSDQAAKARQLLERRAITLRQAAEDAESRGNADAAMELRQKAAHFEKDTFVTLSSGDKYHELIEQTDFTLAKIEEHLAANADKGPWILGRSFQAVDILLVVSLNKLALLGFQDALWANGKRPRLEKALTLGQQRPAFQKAVMEVGDPHNGVGSGGVESQEQRTWKSLW